MALDFPLHEILQKTLYEREDSLALELPLPAKVMEAIGGFSFPKVKKAPYLFSSMVSSLDGRMGFMDDPSGPLISQKNRMDHHRGKADFWFLNLLRTCSHLVIMGAKTLEVEEEAKAIIYDEDLIPGRRAIGLEGDHPINLILTLTGEDLPLEHQILYARDVKVIIATSPEGALYLKRRLPVPFKILKRGEPYRERREIDILETGQGSRTSIEELLEVLRSWGIQRVLVESPSFTWQLLEEGLLHEIFLTYATLYAGGSLLPGLKSPFGSEGHPHARLLRLAMHGEGLLFTRFKMIYNEEEV